MRIRKAYTYKLRPAPEEFIGCFGPVRLVRKSNGLHDLIGGSVKQQDVVRKWCERFAGKIVSFGDPAPVCVIAE